MLIILSAIFVLLLLSAFFSGSETALTAASRPLMHHMEQKGNRRAGLVNRLQAKRERLIGAILLGNNLVNILASALATSMLITLYGEPGVAYATIGMTLLVLVFAEILPKTYAIHHANRMSLAIAPLVNALVMVLSPLTRAINFLVRGILRVFGIDYQANDAYVSSAEELRGAIDLHKGKADTVKHERAMLSSILDLAEVQVGEIMIHRKDVTMVDVEQPTEKIIEEVLSSPFTRIPLWRGQPDNIVCVLHVKALFGAVRTSQGSLKDPADIDVIRLSAKPWFVPEQTTLFDQLQAFRSRREHFALVVDEYGSLMGIVTLEDILEEIVGDISDEHDIVMPGVIPGGDGSYVVNGSVTIRDLNRRFGWKLPDEEAATVAGLILHDSRRIPDIGQVFRFHGLRFEILQRKRQQITSIRITESE
ncbi:MAG: HlyC/CorC family transporter [Rhodospirillaceae bacterium]|jgi:Mg2+/Co2+ transporter CorB|nr:HlyC/CorC family transporter [Rhodospirillaceae bacterium]MBT4464904.1 HlyC/CorC family transporter [Rhodospirillaceae bacterium]MBT5013109.1 HlyC/CorC family transporter [Rhodospirillaceae bacterium]MBT5308540.1 HlyC/CorC family transporter [Rhodospirillaceae bacterium]MBT6407471.1 HlyC/CorC family transporter [Rhodospirillaceae bacterium]